MEKLKDFLEKWQWASLEEADKTLTESEKKIWELMKKNQDLEKQLADVKNSCDYYMKRSNNLVLKLAEKDKRIKKLNIEAQRYYEDAYCNRQDIMQVADKTIKMLAKALELACANHPAVCDEAMDCSKGVDCVGCLVEHYKAQARKELENE